MTDTQTRNLDGTQTDTETDFSANRLLQLSDDLEALIKKAPKAGSFFGNVVHRGNDHEEQREAYIADARVWFDRVCGLTESIRAFPNNVSIRVGREDLNCNGILAMIVQGQRSVRLEAFKEILKARRAR